ncbi:vWA domain-containing protein [Chryseolinea lacunae]|uniref:VWA domain-containing protein n=1 Tax=Chryseolinea lacunae TaxID=2801331 RepID=A0ABS1KW68_9BACT|nr:VWA domain-containing protein [Chryseolinea lacunae]MBL0743585.1 VWA domain-containing protein [Chryseolinea lacunae]
MLFVVVLCALAQGVMAQTKVQQKLPDKTRILFLLDASGSMLEQWERPNQTRWSVAKSILTHIVDSLSRNSKLELALRVYGHRSPQEIKNCKDTYLEVPFKGKNHSLIIDKLKEIKPKGVTPITYSLEQSANDFPAGPGYRNIVILITDGIESCGGDLCAMSRAMQKKGVFLRPYIIGLGLRSEKTLECAGKYIDADTPGKFSNVLNEAIETSFAKTTASIELLDAGGKPVETNVNVTFANTFTGAPMYDFVHYLDKLGRPDTVQIDPVVDYDLTVNTVPPVVKRNITLIPGKHNVIRIPAPQGNLIIKQEGRRDNGLQSVVREKGKAEIINTQQSNETFRYLTGKYEIETLTLPRRIFTIDIQANKTENILLPAPGVVNFNTTATGYGSLYVLRDDGVQEWVCNLNELKSQFALTLLPGQYKIVFRVKQTTGSKYTGLKKFAVQSGETVSVNVFK